MPLTINSPTDICNNALRMLGESTVASVENDSSPAAAIFNTVYNTVRKNLLSSDNWLFAIKRKKLDMLYIVPQQDESSTQELYGFANKFPLPVDYINDVQVMGVDRRLLITSNPLVKLYIIEGGYIYSDQENIILSYVYDNEDITTYSSPFVSCLICSIAMYLSKALHNTEAELQKLQMDFNQNMEIARKFNCRTMQSSGIMMYPMWSEMAGSI